MGSGNSFLLNEIEVFFSLYYSKYLSKKSFVIFNSKNQNQKSSLAKS